MKKEILKAFRKDKETALRKIDVSISKWQKFSEKNKLFRNYNNFKNDHWDYSNRFFNLFNIRLLWSDKIIKSMNNVEELKVINALYGLKKFYLNISSIKPDLSHPEILKCYNLTAFKNNFKIKKVFLKENIDVEILDPFGNVTGKDNQKIKENLTKFKEKALNDIKKEIQTFEEFKISDNQIQFNYKKMSNNIILKKNKKIDLKLNVHGKKIKVLENTKFVNLKKDLLILKNTINSININRPNLNNNLIRKIYFQILKNEQSNKVISVRKILLNIVSKFINKIKRNVPI